MPEAFRATARRYCRGRGEECITKVWERNHRRHCERTVKLARGLVSGRDRRRITRARVIAWGGRCEVPGGACDDPLACARGLARVPHLEVAEGDQKPANAFWCKILTPGCRSDAEPVCVALGYAKKGGGV
jgi:hypothetical protein